MTLGPVRSQQAALPVHCYATEPHHPARRTCIKEWSCTRTSIHSEQSSPKVHQLRFWQDRKGLSRNGWALTRSAALAGGGRLGGFRGACLYSRASRRCADANQAVARSAAWSSSAGGRNVTQPGPRGDGMTSGVLAAAAATAASSANSAAAPSALMTAKARPPRAQVVVPLAEGVTPTSSRPTAASSIVARRFTDPRPPGRLPGPGGAPRSARWSRRGRTVDGPRA